ncbi:hypothetical protein GMD78_12835 [Ornithinibacillus sp. L9]|uniref:Uncharacterized protein n=1 Tax=Ornithinibacillus caprae TaxID=2678566 RepID=A0A6N8FNA7_9BACI|nr:hypothetical protein [Ornithinibacillus caprae]MUK89259.1 hypothetical protein [Ornithinibacillus caprae]
MPYKGKNQYKVTLGEYKNKTGGLAFGYEYTSGNRTKQQQKPKNNNH